MKIVEVTNIDLTIGHYLLEQDPVQQHAHQGLEHWAMRGRVAPLI